MRVEKEREERIASRERERREGMREEKERERTSASREREGREDSE